MDGSAFTFLARGAIIQHFEIHGIDIVQGFPTSELYESHNSPYFGATIGRFANRIQGAAIRVPGGLNGREAYPLAANDGVNALHGGINSWGKKIWDGPSPAGVNREVPGLTPATLDKGGETVQFTLVSPDGDEGFPGTVKVSVKYSVGKQTLPDNDNIEATVLVMEYEAELVDGADATVINMTNHSYFNLGNLPTIEGTVATLGATKYLPVDDGNIPTAGPSAFERVDTSQPFVLGKTEPDFDDCFVVNDQPTTVPIDTRGEPLSRHLAAHHPNTGIHLEVYSTEPAFQFYTGKHIDVPAVGGLPARVSRSGFCLEPSRYVNASNVEDWKNQVLLKKGDKYGSRTVYRAWKQ